MLTITLMAFSITPIIYHSLSPVSLYLINLLAWRIPPKPETHAIELADLDGDGDLDAFLANGRNEAAEPNTVLWNDGNGIFQDSGQRLGDFESRGLALADFDDDGDIDALVSNSLWGVYFWNNGRGQFQRNQPVSMPTTEGFPVGIWRFKPGDLNGDSQVDLFLTGCCGGGYSNSAGHARYPGKDTAVALLLVDRFFFEFRHVRPWYLERFRAQCFRCGDHLLFTLR